MNNLTNEELIRFNRIKNLTKSGSIHLVTAEDKQFILDMLAKTKQPIDSRVRNNAVQQGFRVNGIVEKD